MKASYAKHLFFTLLAAIFIVGGCSKEDPSGLTDSLTETAQKWFTKNPGIVFEQNQFYKGTLDWDKAIRLNDKVLIPITQAENMTMKTINENLYSGKGELYLHPYLVMIKDAKKESFKLNLQVFLSYDAGYSSNCILEKLYIVFDENNKITNNTLAKKHREQLVKYPNAIGLKNMPEDCILMGLYEVFSDGSMDLIMTYMVCGGADGGNNGSAGGDGGYTEPGPEEPPLPIIDSKGIEGNKIAKCVYDRFYQNYLLQVYLDEFKPKNSLMDLKYSLSTSLVDNRAGQTTYSSTNNTIEIFINENSLAQSSSFAIASTFIHETIHAHLCNYLASVNYDKTKLVGAKYEDLFQYYMDTKVGGKFDANNAQHAKMAEGYIDIMKNALKAFDSSYTDEQCRAMAWQGLQNTMLFKLKLDWMKIQINNTISQIISNGKKDCM